MSLHLNLWKKPWRGHRPGFFYERSNYKMLRVTTRLSFRAIGIKKVGCDGLDRCGQFVEQCSRLQVSTVLWVLGSFGAPPVGGLLKV